jgi:hypothetical protein
MMMMMMIAAITTAMIMHIMNSAKENFSLKYDFAFVLSSFGENI